MRVLIHFMPLVFFVLPENKRKPEVFLMFSGGIEGDQCHKMDLKKYFYLSAGIWSNFHERLSKQVAQLEKLNIVSECQILKKILFKHQNQMRRDKSFQYAKKVRFKYVLRDHRFQIPRLILTFYFAMP